MYIVRKEKCMLLTSLYSLCHLLVIDIEYFLVRIFIGTHAFIAIIFVKESIGKNKC